MGIMGKMFGLVLFLCMLIIAGTRADTPSCDDNLPQHVPEQIHLSLTFEEDSMVVMWNTKLSTPTSTVRYRRGSCSSASGPWLTESGTSHHYGEYDGHIHTVTLKDLAERSKYCYSVGDECRGFSPEQEFRTADPDRMVFAALADAGTWGNVTQVFGDLAADDDPALVIHAGDLSYAQEDKVWDKFGYMMELVASTKPYMIIPGNWDVKPFAIRAFLNRFSMPLVHPSTEKTPSYYYSFNYSVVHFVMMSSYDSFNVTSPQYKWLVEDLEAADADRENHPWIVITFHSPMYSSSVGHGGSDMAFRSIVEPVLKKYHVDLAFSGHDHGYERTYPVYGGVPTNEAVHHYVSPESTIHILAGTAGATVDDWLDKPEWTAHREGSYGYTKVYATYNNLRVRYRRMDGDIGDEFSINKKPVAPEKAPVVGVVLLLAIVFVVFPYCAYKGIPNRVFNELLGHSNTGNYPYLYKSHV